MDTSLKYNIEKFWKDELDLRIANLPIFVTERDDEVEVEGSYAVCQVKEMQEAHPGSGVYYVDCQIWLMTNIDDSTSAEHSCTYKAITDSIRDTQYTLFPFKNNPVDKPAGCRVFGWGPVSHAVEEYSQTWGDLFMLRGGFGHVPGVIPDYDVDSGEWSNYQTKTMHHEIKKIDATSSAIQATIPANTITHSAFLTDCDGALTVDGTELDEGEALNRDQINVPGNQPTLGIWPQSVIVFPLGTTGTINYVAESNLGPVVCVEV